MIRSESLADEVRSGYTSGKEFAYDHASPDKLVLITKGTDTRIRKEKKVYERRPSPVHRAVHREDKWFTKIHLPRPEESQHHNQWIANMLCNKGIQSQDIWNEVGRFFMKEKK